MMKWSWKHSIIAGLSLILVTNAIALAGVAFNRSGAPENMVQLTQRELGLPWRGMDASDDSSISLILRWRVLSEIADDSDDYIMSRCYSNEPAWLDKAKLSSLGFDVSRPGISIEDRNFYKRQLKKDVLLVLEIDGTAYRQSLKRLQGYAAQAAVRLAADPDNKDLKENEENTRKQLAREESEQSRLFVVDAGLDRAPLRSKYPDAGRYAIVRGQVRPVMSDNDGKYAVRGMITGVSIDRINVPASYRTTFEPMLQSHSRYTGRQTARYSVTIAYGKRLEPWIVAVKKAE